MRSTIPWLIALALLTLNAGFQSQAGAAENKTLNLWPNGAPDETAKIGPEQDTTKADSGLVAGRRLIRLGNVSQPTITFYPAPKDKATGAAVVVCPGGGYNILAMDLEGTEICAWLNSIGVSGVLLKYRVPIRKGRERYAAPLQDAQRALGLTRAHAAQWGLNPKRIGIMGFSAGGHLSATASNNFEKRTYAPVDAADGESCRPDFTLLIYPAYLTVKDQGDKLAPELKVTAHTPPTFLVQTEDDVIRVETSLFYYLALKQAKVPAEMHLYSAGGHGYGLRTTEKAVTGWPKLAEVWLRGQGLLGTAEQAPREKK